MIDFPTDFDAIWARIESINPNTYARTRNFTDGAVTYLSPYLTHGVITPRDIMESILSKYSFKDCEKLIQELAWREFFQLVWRVQGDTIFTDLRFAKEPVSSHKIPASVIEAHTSIAALDKAITHLYKTGYMHNHARMWLASLVCNRGQYHWKAPAAWLYYHLLDGDVASNTLSWQWCAGTFASKKYWANQQNINRYTKTKQIGTILDYPYETLPHMSVPEVLKVSTNLDLKSNLPQSEIHEVHGEVLFYHPWSLNPRWHKKSHAMRVLILEPSHFERFPVSQKRIQFLLKLAKEIPNIQVFVGELNQLKGIGKSSITYVQHPSISHWNTFFRHASAEQQSLMFAPNMKYYKSFFSYWKACQKTQAFKDISS